jgi:arabinose-5-phosphate isomerase
LIFKKPPKISKLSENTEQIIRKTALRTLQIELEAIQALEQSINEDFISCVELISRLKGRLVVTGIGKSALIAQKMVATFNSTGTPSLFMHAADAIHGDLGMIQPGDAVLCLSKSGETPEIKVLVPLLRQFGHLLIGMVAVPDSYLGRHADLLLHTPIAQEADPNNLAPTASTTAQAVLGDALATSLLALRGFSPSDFAQYHPGGMLGKQLYLRVYDLYSQNQAPAVLPDSGIRETILEMTTKRLGCTAVVDESRKLLGIITDGDLRRMLEVSEDIRLLRAADIMSARPKTLQPDEMAIRALERLRNHSISQLLVCDADGHYLGVLHLHDLIREGFL